jgi:aspartate kinase
MAIATLGPEARSFTGSQAGVITDSAHGRARIIDVTPGRIRQALDEGHIAIVAGFQGVSQDTKDITTLGRGGPTPPRSRSPPRSAADVCEIYTDVDGVFTADPRIVPSARRIERISSEEMLEMAASGRQDPAPALRRVRPPVRAAGARRSSFSHREGTWVTDQPPAGGDTVEQPIISGVAHDRSEAKITVVGVPDKPGKAAEIFEAVAAAEINIDMIVQNISAAATGLTDVSFTLPKTDGQTAMAALTRVQGQVGFDSLVYDDQIGKVSLIGAGMRSHPGVSARCFAALADAGVNIEMISTSEIRLSVVTRADRLDDAVRAMHTASAWTAAEGEAVVYGGTGR